MKLPIVLSSLLWLSACAVPASQIGFAVVSPQGEGRLYLSGEIDPARETFIKWAAPNGGEACCLAIPRSGLRKIDVPVALAMDATTVAYAVGDKLPELAFHPLVGIVASSDKAALARVGLRLCFGEEGVNLIASEREHPRVQYIGLGHAIDESPRCNSRDQSRIGTSVQE